MKCRWNCGQSTRNISRICDDCWRTTAVMTYEEWVVRRRSRATSSKAKGKPFKKGKTSANFHGQETI